MPETMQKAAGLSVVDKLRMLLDITKTISRSLDLKEVLNLVMDTLDSLIPYDAAGIYLVKCDRPVSEWEEGTDETCVFQTEAVRGYDIADLQELRLKMGEGLIGYVATRGKPFIAPDVSKEPRYIDARARTRSELIAPIISNDQVI
ncbi:MAG TPA: GAF domain-containing protein, partial [Pyrinomonadaceae bacterium]|nr:GAF domain-containing protein [Pyrinomonadaceae bacterium]